MLQLFGIYIPLARLKLRVEHVNIYIYIYIHIQINILICLHVLLLNFFDNIFIEDAMPEKAL